MVHLIGSVPIQMSSLHYRNNDFKLAISKYLNEANPNNSLKGLVTKNGIDGQKWHCLFTKGKLAEATWSITIQSLSNDGQ